jgi:hypothetical protein
MGANMPLIHITGPQCSGKTYIIEKAKAAYGERIKSWDIWDFYRNYNILNDRGEMIWDLWRQHEHQIAPEMIAFINEYHGHADLTIIESSGISVAINLAFKHLKGYQKMRLALEPCTSKELPGRAAERKLNLRDVQDFGRVYDQKRENTTTYSQKQALSGIQEIMHQILRGGWCGVCSAPLEDPQDLCCLPRELGWGL